MVTGPRLKVWATYNHLKACQALLWCKWRSPGVVLKTDSISLSLFTIFENKEVQFPLPTLVLSPLPVL